MIASTQLTRHAARAWRDRLSLILTDLSTSARFRRAVRLLSFALLFGLIAFFVREQRGQWTALRATLARIDWRWLVLAALARSTILGVTVCTYRAVLRKIGYDLSWGKVTTVCTRNMVVSTVAPVGLAGSVVAMKTLSEQDVPGDDAVFAVALAEIVNYASTLVVLLPTALFLAIDDEIPDVVLFAVGLMTLVLGGIAFALARLLGGEAPPRLLRWLPRRGRDFIAAARQHQLRLRDLSPALAWAVIGELASIVVLAAVLHAVGHHAYASSTPIIGYEIGNAASQVAPVYQGIGAVEIAMVLALRHQGVGRPVALAATLIYRAGSLWLPFALALAWQTAGSVRGSEDRSSAPAPHSDTPTSA